MVNILSGDVSLKNNVVYTLIDWEISQLVSYLRFAFMYLSFDAFLERNFTNINRNSNGRKPNKSSQTSVVLFN